MNKFAVRSIVQAMAIAGFAALSLSATATPSLADYTCKPVSVQASATAKIHATARAKARSAWSGKVENRYHLAWSVWSIAKNQSLDCSKAGTSWSCVARAKPCLYVVQ